MARNLWETEPERKPLPRGQRSKCWPDEDGWHIIISTALTDEEAHEEEKQVKAREMREGRALIPVLVAARLGGHARRALPAVAVAGGAAAVVATAVFAVALHVEPGQTGNDVLGARPGATVPERPAALPGQRGRGAGGRPVRAGVPSPSPVGDSPLRSGPLSQVLTPGAHPLRAAVGSHPLAPVRGAAAAALPHLPVAVPSLRPHPVRAVVSHLPTLPVRPRP